MCRIKKRRISAPSTKCDCQGVMSGSTPGRAPTDDFILGEMTTIQHKKHKHSFNKSEGIDSSVHRSLLSFFTMSLSKMWWKLSPPPPVRALDFWDQWILQCGLAVCCNTRYPKEQTGRTLPGPESSHAHPSGASDFGVHDLVGNVWQYTDHFYNEWFYCPQI